VVEQDFSPTFAATNEYIFANILRLLCDFHSKQHATILYGPQTMLARRCKKVISVFLRTVVALKESPFKRQATLGKTLYEWQDEVARMRIFLHCFYMKF
jgi:hypothetical protein